MQAQLSGWAALQPCWDRGSHHPRAPASHRFSVLRNLLPGWKRCLRLLETECFLLWGWFLQGSVEQRAEDAAAGDEELIPTHWEGPAGISTARAVSLLFTSLAQSCSCTNQLCSSHHNPGTQLPLPQPPWSTVLGLTVANAVLVDGLHLAQEMVQSLGLSSPPWRPPVVLAPVCGDTAASPRHPLPVGGTLRGTRVPIPSSHISWMSPSCHSTAAVVGTGHFWACWAMPSFVPLFPGTPSSAQHLVATSLPTAWQGHTRGKEQGSVCCCYTSLALKIKFFPVSSSRSFPVTPDELWKPG